MTLRSFRALGDFESNGLMNVPKGQDQADRVWMARFINVAGNGWPISRDTGETITFTSALDFERQHDEMEAVEFYDEEMLEIYGDRIKRTASKGTKIFPLRMLGKYLDRCDVLIGHNFIQYDVQLVKKFLNYDWYKGAFELDDERRIIDTLVMSRTQHVDRPAIKGVKGPHGLASWGERMGIPKPEHEEWKVFSMDMVKRLREDVKINVMTYVELIRENLEDKEFYGINWRNALQIEHRASTIIARAERVGCGFDQVHARKCVAAWDILTDAIDKEVYPLLPLRFTQPTTTKDGNADYVDLMESKMEQPLIDQGHFIEQIVMEEDEYGDMIPVIEKDGTPRMFNKAYWPKEWDFDNDDIKHGRPTTEPFLASMELSHHVQAYFHKGYSEGTKIMSARQQMDFMMPSTRMAMFPERILKGWLKAVDPKVKKEGDFLVDPEAFVKWMVLNKVLLNNLGDTKDGTATKKANASLLPEDEPIVITSVPKWLLTEEIVGPYTLIREPVKDIVVGPYSKVKYVDYELTSNNQVKNLLLKHFKWIPDEFTDKGNPKLTESSFRNMESDIGGKVQSRFVTAARRTTVLNYKDDSKGWLNLVRADGQITCRNTPQGTPTARSRHAGVVNVPSVDAILGREMRRCFVAPEDSRVGDWNYEMKFKTSELRDIFADLEESLTIKQERWEAVTDQLDKKGNKIVDYYVRNHINGRMAQVGCDFSGLELRILAHLMNDEKTTYEIVDGDFHSVLWKLVDDHVATRGDTKTLEYAMIFGAGDCKLGSVATLNRDMYDEEFLFRDGWLKLGGGYRLQSWRPDKSSITFIEAQNTVIGSVLRERIMKGLKPLGDCIDKLTADAEKGYLVAIDGRMLPVRGVHAALNLACQSGGALVAKKGLDLVAVRLEEFRKEYDDFFGELVIYYHDEVQIHCNPKYAQLVGEMCRRSFVEAGEYYDLACPMDGEFKIGTGWLSCH